jgi:hypothetical protein
MAQSFWPGRSYRSNVTAATGEAEAWQEAERMFARIGETATNIYLMDGQDQLSTAQIQIKAAEAEYVAEIENEQDQNKYDAILAKHTARVRALRPKHPLAAKRFDNIYANKQINWSSFTQDAKRDRLNDKWEVKRDILEKQYIESGDESLYVQHMMAGIAMGRDESETMKRIEVAKGRAEYDEALRRIQVNPQGYLDSLKKGKPPILEGLTSVANDPGKMMAMKNIAEGFVNEQKLDRGRLTLEQEMAINKAAADPNTETEFMEKKISQSDGLTPEQKINAMNKYTAARRTMAKGGTNPYTTTSNHARLKDMKRRAREKTLTEEEIYRWEGDVDGVSIIDADKLRNILSEKDDASKTAQEIKSEGLIEDIIKTTPLGSVEFEEPLPEEYKIFGIRKALRQYNDWRAAQEGPIKPRDDEFMALKIARDMKRDLEQRRFGGLEEFFAPGLTRPEDVPIGKSLGLESIWDELTDIEKRHALRILAQGRTSQEIIDYFNEQ